MYYSESHKHIKVHYDEVIGRMGSNVFAGSICGLGGKVAVKQFRINTDANKMLFQNELKMMRLFSGREGFVQCLDCVVPEDDQEFAMIIMEKCDATFEDILNGNFVISPKDGLTYDATLLDLIKQIIQAVHTLACSEDPIAHRDLKIDNLFVKESKRDKKLIAKIGDFGTSREFAQLDFRTTDRFGSANYLAPELLKRVVDKSVIKFDPAEWHKIDMFAIGCCIGELFTGKHPFGTPDMVTANISKGNVSLDPIVSLPFFCKGQLCNLVCALTQKDPSLRPTAVECLKHPLFQDPARKVTRISEMNTILKRIEHGEESKDPERRELLERYDEHSALIIGGKGNWLYLIPDELKCCLNKGYDITKASSLCRFLRNVIQHLGEDRPDLKLTVFGDSNLTQAQMFLRFEEVWPFLDGHNMWFLSEEKKCMVPTKFSEAQNFLEVKMLDEGMKNKTIAPLQSTNTLKLCVGDEPCRILTFPSDKVSAYVPMDKLRTLLQVLGYQKNTYEILGSDRNKLKDPLLDSSVVILEFKEEIFHV